MRKSACFTGHRSFTGDTENLDTRLYDILEREIIKKNAADFYTGGAVGWDELSAQTVLKLHEVYPHIKLHLILPCSNEEQTAKWTKEQKTEFFRILDLADTVEYTSEHYYHGCMKVRNTVLWSLPTSASAFGILPGRKAGRHKRLEWRKERKL